MKGWMKEVYKMGGVNAISWHMDNFVTGGSTWDNKGRVVGTILPGGANHEAYKAKLDIFAGFVKDLRVGFIFKKDIPIIFRPFHEHTGDWFWWGAAHCTPEEYKQIWQFTVKYLRDEKGLHNLLWSYSPDVFKDKAHYLERYPGDEYVDILGFDDYHDVGAHGNIEDLTRRLGIVVSIANEKGKLAALTETGFEKIPDPNWWTDKLLKHIKSDPLASQIAWVMMWRNARKSHHYGPYPGHESAANFVKFSKDPILIFQDKLPNLYKLK
jgi:mannan endo-1,4-beta-mannosidase